MKIIYIVLLSSLLYAQPAWIKNTNSLNTNYIYGLGISNDKDVVAKRQIAIINARADLAQNIKVTISSDFKMVTESKNTNYSMKTKSIIEQKALELLVGSTVEDSFTDIDNVLYILMKVNKSKIKKD